MQQARPATGAHLRRKRRGRRVNGEDVVAVHLLAGDADRARTCKRALAGSHAVGRGGRRPAVVLADK
jgi:hypothetical protein